MSVPYKIMVHSYLNATCIFHQPIFIICGRVNKEREKNSKCCEEYGKTFAEEMD